MQKKLIKLEVYNISFDKYDVLNVISACLFIFSPI